MTECAWFRDPESCRALRRTIVPVLRTYPSVNVWLPACGTGVTAYETALVLREEGIGGRTRIYATDSSEATVATARLGSYAARVITCATGAYRDGGGRATLDEYFMIEGDQAVMRPALRDRIVFLQYDLESGVSFNEFQLVVCRGVLSNLEPELRARVSCLVDESLCRLGIVLLGGGEQLSLASSGAKYEPIPEARSFQRKVA